MGDYKSLIDYRGDVLINVCIMLLITLGGLGFVVLEDLRRGFKWKRFALQTKIVLLTTLGLNVIGTILIWLLKLIILILLEICRRKKLFWHLYSRRFRHVQLDLTQLIWHIFMIAVCLY